MSAIQQTLYFILSTAINLFIMLLWARFALRAFNVSALHPISQMIYKATNPIIVWVEKTLFPKSYRLGRWDWPCFASIVFIEIIKYGVLTLVAFYSIMPLTFWVLFTVVSLIVQPLNLLFYIVLISAVLSFIMPEGQMRLLADVLSQLSNPFLDPIRRYLPIMGGFDFSPLVLMIVIKAITIFLGALLPISQFGL